MLLEVCKWGRHSAQGLPQVWDCSPWIPRVGVFELMHLKVSLRCNGGQPGSGGHQGVWTTFICAG